MAAQGVYSCFPTKGHASDFVLDKANDVVMLGHMLWKSCPGEFCYEGNYPTQG